MITQDEMKTAYQTVIDATKKVQELGYAFEHAKNELEKKVMLATANGLIQGKNETERKSLAYEMFKSAYDDLENKEEQYRVSTNTLAIARLELDCVKACFEIDALTYVAV